MIISIKATPRMEQRTAIKTLMGNESPVAAAAALVVAAAAAVPEDAESVEVGVESIPSLVRVHVSLASTVNLVWKE